MLAASLISVLASIFAMHKAHETHVTSLGSRIVSLEKQIEDARAHENTLETRIALLEKEADEKEAESNREGGGEAGVGESKIAEALAAHITEALATHVAAMESSAELRHLRELTHYSNHFRLEKANAAGFSYEAAKAVYCEEFLVEISRENKSHMAKHRASDCLGVIVLTPYFMQGITRLALMQTFVVVRRR